MAKKRSKSFKNICFFCISDRFLNNLGRLGGWLVKKRPKTLKNMCFLWFRTLFSHFGRWAGWLAGWRWLAGWLAGWPAGAGWLGLAARSPQMGETTTNVRPQRLWSLSFAAESARATKTITSVTPKRHRRCPRFACGLVADLRFETKVPVHRPKRFHDAFQKTKK